MTSQMHSPLNIVGIGELVWDLFRGHARLGGAPANVAYHATALGDRGIIASRVGIDTLGRDAMAHLQRHGVDTSCVQVDPTRASGTVEVSVEDGQPSYVIARDSAWSFPEWTAAWDREVREAHALVFGTLAQTMPGWRDVFASMASAVRRDAVRLVDLNLRDGFDSPDAVECAISFANAAKLNEEEVGFLSRMFGVTDPVDWLMGEKNYRFVAVTRGKNGSILVTPNERNERPGVERALEGDAVGAGDAFAAAMLHHLLRGAPAAQANRAANYYASFVGTRVGAMPEIPDELRREVSLCGHPVRT